MLKRYEDEMMNRLDILTNVGWTSIRWWELRKWYGMERITKKVYRDLRDRFLEDNDGELNVYHGESELLLIHSDNLSTISKNLGDAEAEAP